MNSVDDSEALPTLFKSTHMIKKKPATKSQSVSKQQNDRIFVPPAHFSKDAHIRSMSQYRKMYKESIDKPDRFWGRLAGEELVWMQPWKKVLQFKAPNAKWFVGGKLNVSANCLDRHLGTATANKAAIIWEGEPAGPGKPAEERVLTYQQLHREVCMFANVLKRHKIGRGDRVLIYLPMVPEAAIAMLACARIGAVHSVVFGGFSAQSVADRVFDSKARMIITADGGFRRGSVVPLKKSVDDAFSLKDGEGTADIALIRIQMTAGIASLRYQICCRSWTVVFEIFECNTI